MFLRKNHSSTVLSNLTFFGAALMALAVLPGCGGGHSANEVQLWKTRLQKVCSSTNALNINKDMQDTLQKLSNIGPSWVVRTVLVSDSAESLTAKNLTPPDITIYSQLPVQNTATQLNQANAMQVNSPDLMHVTLNCNTLMATYFGPGVNSQSGVTGLIKEPTNKWTDNVGDLTKTDLYISDATDEIVNPTTNKPTPVKVDIHIQKVVPDYTDPTQGERQWAEEKQNANTYGIRTYTITITQKLPWTQPRKLVIMQTVEPNPNATVKVSADVLAMYLGTLPPTYVAQMLKSTNREIRRLGKAASGGEKGLIAFVRSAGNKKLSVDINILEEARAAFAAAHASLQKQRSTSRGAKAKHQPPATLQPVTVVAPNQSVLNKIKSQSQAFIQSLKPKTLSANVQMISVKKFSPKELLQIDHSVLTANLSSPANEQAKAPAAAKAISTANNAILTQSLADVAKKAQTRESKFASKIAKQLSSQIQSANSAQPVTVLNKVVITGNEAY